MMDDVFTQVGVDDVQELEVGQKGTQVIKCFDHTREIKYKIVPFLSWDRGRVGWSFLDRVAKQNPEFFSPTGGWVPNAFSFRMRCQKKLHRIIVWPDGAVTLTAHLGKAALMKDEMWRVANGKKCSCRSFKEQWIHEFRGGWRHFSEDKLPQKAKALLKIIKQQTRHRRTTLQGKLYVSERMKQSQLVERELTLENRIELLKKRARPRFQKIFNDRLEEVFGKYPHQLNDNIEKGVRNLKAGLGPLFAYEDGYRWRKPLMEKGIFQADLRTPGFHREGYGREMIPVFPIRIFPFRWPESLPPDHLVIEAMDKNGYQYLLEIRPHPSRKVRWKIHRQIGFSSNLMKEPSTFPEEGV
tara:strand:- start:14759 stop:15823 length:1065 start_codon:yes stop_codon:yes gene_type:complete